MAQGNILLMDFRNICEQYKVAINWKLYRKNRCNTREGNFKSKYITRCAMHGIFTYINIIYFSIHYITGHLGECLDLSLS